MVDFNQSNDNTLDLLDSLVKSAVKAGADAADAVAIEGSSRGVSWLDGKLEDVEGSEGEDIGLRVMIGKRQAIVSSSDRRPDRLSEIVQRTIDMARAVPEDDYCGLAPTDRLAKAPFQDLELYDDTHVSATQLREIAAECEDAARAVKGVTKSGGAGASAGTYKIALATSHGFAGSYKGSSFSASVSVVAGDGTAMERDYDHTSARFYADLKSAADVGKSAGERAVRRLNPSKLSSGQMSVVFDPRAGNSLLGHFAGAVNGTSVARGSSFLKDAMGDQIFAPNVTIVDDPFMKRGLASKLFDGEGVSVRCQNLVEAGVLKTWTLNSAAARQLGLDVTGHATRGTSGTPGIGTSNLYMQAGEISPTELLADIQDGLYITELIGMGVNGVTGDYSRGASGFRIQGGEVTDSVSEITIASTLQEMFKNITPADDLTFEYGINVPTLRIDGMMIAGS